MAVDHCNAAVLAAVCTGRISGEPASGEVVEVVNMMTSAKWADFLKDMGKTWMTFAPMITVPLCTLGMAVATHSGMMNAMLKSAGATTSE